MLLQAIKREILGEGSEDEEGPEGSGDEGEEEDDEDLEETERQQEAQQAIQVGLSMSLQGLAKPEHAPRVSTQTSRKSSDRRLPAGPHADGFLQAQHSRHNLPL